MPLYRKASATAAVTTIPKTAYPDMTKQVPPAKVSAAALAAVTEAVAVTMVYSLTRSGMLSILVLVVAIWCYSARGEAKCGQRLAK